MARRITQYTARGDELGHRWDRALRWSLVASILFHVLLVLLFWNNDVLPETLNSAAGPRSGDPSAAAGGGMEAVTFAIPAVLPTPEPIVKPPDPVPVPDAPKPPEEPPEEVKPSSPAPGPAVPSAGDGRGQTTGPGTDTGTGRGDGGTGDEGLYRITAPSPRGLILPPSDRPGKVRGKSVTVFVFVTDKGTVVEDSTRLNPSSGDSKFDNRLKQQASEWRFRPAMRAGQAIAAWFQYTMTF